MTCDGFSCRCNRFMLLFCVGKRQGLGVMLVKPTVTLEHNSEAGEFTCFTMRPPRQWARKTMGRFVARRRVLSRESRARALSRIPAAELLRYMSPLYPNDRTLVSGLALGNRRCGHPVPSSSLLLHVLMGSPSRPWTRTRLGGVSMLRYIGRC